MLESDADEERARGNELYKEVQSSFCEPSTEGNLNAAKECYDKALRLSYTDMQRASAYKNLGSLFFLWAKWARHNTYPWNNTTLAEETCTKCSKHLAEAVSYYSMARTEGMRNPREWLWKVEELMFELIDWAADNDWTPFVSSCPSSNFLLLRAVCEAMDKPGQQCSMSCYAHSCLAGLLLKGFKKIKKGPKDGDNDVDEKDADDDVDDKDADDDGDDDDDGDKVLIKLQWIDAILSSIAKSQMVSKCNETGHIVQQKMQKTRKMIKPETWNLLEDMDKEMQSHILDELKDTLKILRIEANKSTEDYLRFLYASHPHPNSDFKLGNLTTPDETKKAMMTALHHYHPDRNIQHELKWRLLCIEITKHLNSKYEYYR